MPRDPRARDPAGGARPGLCVGPQMSSHVLNRHTRLAHGPQVGVDLDTSLCPLSRRVPAGAVGEAGDPARRGRSLDARVPGWKAGLHPAPGMEGGVGEGPQD